MTDKHTPGPWYTELVTKTDTGLQETTILARNDSRWLSGGRTIAEVGHWRDRIDPEADARLIAAAPELLSALEAIDNNFASTDNNAVIISVGQLEQARRAIKAAKGDA